MFCFDKDGFLEWIKEEFPGVIDTHFNYDMMDNLLEYAILNKDYSQIMFIDFLESIIPEITHEEIKKFITE